MKKNVFSFAAAGFLILLAAPILAGECESAAADYDAAVTGIGNALANYQNCVANSKASQDCADEFRNLAGAQDSFEKIITVVQGACKQ